MGRFPDLDTYITVLLQENGKGMSFIFNILKRTTVFHTKLQGRNWFGGIRFYDAVEHSSKVEILKN
jgi:hypothetical protein